MSVAHTSAGNRFHGDAEPEGEPAYNPITADIRPTETVSTNRCAPRRGKSLSGLLVLAAMLLPPGTKGQGDSSDQHFEGEASLSAVVSRGNADATTVSGALDLLWEGPRHRQMATLKALKSSEEGDTSAERYFASAQADINITRRSYLFTLADYEADRFSGYHFRSNLLGGYGYRLLRTDAHRLEAEAGPGLRLSGARQDDVEEGTEATLRIAARHRWHLGRSATIRQAISSTHGREAIVNRYDAALTSDIVGSVSLRLAYTVRHVSNTPPDVTDIDQTMTVGLAYRF